MRYRLKTRLYSAGDRMVAWKPARELGHLVSELGWKLREAG